MHNKVSRLVTMKCQGGTCLLNPLGFESTCWDCPQYAGQKPSSREAYAIAIDEDGVAPCPYYGGDCLVAIGAGAVGEWCAECAVNKPENIFREAPAKKQRVRKTKRREFQRIRTCESCGAEFWAIQGHQRFCSVKCRKREKYRRYFKRKREQKQVCGKGG